MCKSIVAMMLVFLALTVSCELCSEESLPDPTRPLGYKPSSNAVERLTLQAIFFGNGRKEAIISGVLVKEGGRVSGRRVQQIKRDRIIIESSTGVEVLSLRPSIFSK